MTAQRYREIVIEFERVQMIRKHAKTTYRFCDDCGGEKDFVEIRTAADLFGIAVGDLHSFIAANKVHHAANEWLNSGICIPSLLVVIHERNNGREVKLIGIGGGIAPDEAALAAE